MRGCLADVVSGMADIFHNVLSYMVVVVVVLLLLLLLLLVVSELASRCNVTATTCTATTAANAATAVAAATTIPSATLTIPSATLTIPSTTFGDVHISVTVDHQSYPLTGLVHDAHADAVVAWGRRSVQSERYVSDRSQCVDVWIWISCHIQSLPLKGLLTACASSSIPNRTVGALVVVVVVVAVVYSD
jgi:hypothetical protein